MARVTLRQVAKLSGVSFQTVSRILNGQEHLHNPETVARVHEAAQELRYQPNSSARAMRSGKTGCLSLVLSDEVSRSNTPGAMLDGIIEAAELSGHHFTITRMPDQKLTDESFMPRILRERIADGLLLNYTTNVPPLMNRLLEKYRVPAVWVNIKRDHDCIYPDDYEAGRRAAGYWMERDFETVAFIQTIRTCHYSYADRKAGYRSAMEEAGRAPLVLEAFDENDVVPSSERIAWAREQLRDLPRPLALVGYGMDAVRTFFAAGQSMGLQPGRDLHASTFHQHYNEDTGYPVHIMRIPSFEVGRQAVSMLIRKIQTPSRLLDAVRVPYDNDFCHMTTDAQM